LAIAMIRLCWTSEGEAEPLLGLEPFFTRGFFERWAPAFTGASGAFGVAFGVSFADRFEDEEADEPPGERSVTVGS